MASPIRLGLELEFMVAFPSNKTGGPGGSDDKRFPNTDLGARLARAGCDKECACMLQVCKVLDCECLPVITLTEPAGLVNKRDPITWSFTEGDMELDNKGETYRTWNKDKAGKNGGRLEFDYWNVTKEGYITSHVDMWKDMEQTKQYPWSAVEISSPIFTNEGPFDCSFDQVEKALIGLRNTTNIWLNSLVGMHIHASPSGAGNGKEIDDMVAKRVTAMVFLMEKDFLLRCCHPCRAESMYTAPLSRYSNIADENWESESNSKESRPYVEALRQFRYNTGSRSVDEPHIFRCVRNIFKQESMTSLIMGTQVRFPRCMVVGVSSQPRPQRASPASDAESDKPRPVSPATDTGTDEPSMAWMLPGSTAAPGPGDFIPAEWEDEARRRLDALDQRQREQARECQRSREKASPGRVRGWFRSLRRERDGKGDDSSDGRTSSSSAESLPHNLRGGGNCGIVFSSFGTIEFRYPEASFDSEFVSFWVQIVHRIMKAACKENEAEFIEMFMKIYEMATRPSGPASLNEWMDLFKMEEEHKTYMKKRIKSYAKELKDLNKQPILAEIPRVHGPNRKPDDERESLHECRGVMGMNF